MLGDANLPFHCTFSQCSSTFVTKIRCRQLAQKMSDFGQLQTITAQLFLNTAVAAGPERVKPVCSSCILLVWQISTFYNPPPSSATVIYSALQLSISCPSLTHMKFKDFSAKGRFLLPSLSIKPAANRNEVDAFHASFQAFLENVVLVPDCLLQLSPGSHY